jgi:hypothetical protein
VIQSDIPESSQAGFSTPQPVQVEIDAVTPSSVNESGAMKFRSLDEIYDET